MLRRKPLESLNDGWLKKNEARALQRQGSRAEMAAGLERPRPVQDEQRRPASEILRARDVPVSVGSHPYGPRAQLHHGRRGGALQARAWLQRTPPHGLGR